MEKGSKSDHSGTSPLSDVYRSAGITFDLFQSGNPAMRQTIDVARRAAATNIHILILGEVGTGKNFLAQSIHNASPRREGPFLSVNCGALPASLLESELFGHERGAFTGADRAHRGRFEIAGGGTLFLDEIADLPLTSQAKLLRVVEYRQFERVGGEKTLHADIRLVCASSRDLEELVQMGRFRDDLFRRLGEEVVLRLPPLRDRPEDLLDLAHLFLDEWRARLGRHEFRISREAETALLRFSWPGNVRQLRNTMKRAVVLAAGDTLSPEDLGLGADMDASESPAVGDLSLSAAEARHIIRVLELAGGNKSRAAALLGIARTTLDRKIRVLRGRGQTAGDSPCKK